MHYNYRRAERLSYIYLRGKERSEQRVEAAGTEVRDAEVDERQLLSSTHRSEVDDAAARFPIFFIARRSNVLRQRHGGPRQADPSSHRVTSHRRRPDNITE